MAEDHARRTAAEAPGDARAAALRGRLASPFGPLAVRVSDGAASRCRPPPEPFAGPLTFPSKYEGSDRARDTLNRDADERYKLATRSIQAFEAGVSELSNRYVKGDAGAAACALDWLDHWARADALDGEANMTGRAVRKWALAAAAFSYLKIREAPGLDAGRLLRSADWMRRLARVVVRENDDLRYEKINNHYYWAAAAIAATAVATDDQPLLEWSLAAYRRSVRAIDDDGALPREMARRSRALAYHLYALQPLVMLAEIGRANGVDLYAENDGALLRLVGLVVRGIDDPGYFEEHTAARQFMDGNPDGGDLLWVPILAAACPGDARLQALQTRFAPFSGRRLGGNLTDVYEHHSKEHTHAIQTQACRYLWR